ncbi:FAR1 DNA-binding domain [Phytophthora infestans]|uniref:FAR1 DNA-binding domain n=2 Tax=Phytophthora infestans TaxID=4787 RepID=A0A8S9UR24_PHYIN|nr:FAR1 DNA-binding domain [Phytophthora infestans]
MPQREARRTHERSRAAITGSESESEASYEKTPRRKRGEARSARLKAKRRRRYVSSRDRALSSDDSSDSEQPSQRRDATRSQADVDPVDEDAYEDNNSSSGRDSDEDGGGVTARDELVSVPPLDRRSFDTWALLEAYIKADSKRTYQVYSVRTATPASTRSAKIKETNSYCDKIPAELKFYNKTYVCTHSGSPRTGRSRRGGRPNQYSRRIGCKAQINACVRLSGDWAVCITKQVTDSPTRQLQLRRLHSSVFGGTSW